MPESKDISNITKRIIAQRLEVDEDLIADDTNFARDLGMDSLAGVEIVLDLEEKFGIEMPDIEAERLIKFKQVVDYIQKKVSSSAIERKKKKN